VVDLENLQSNLNRLVEWSHTWQLKISYTKCSLLYINGMTDAHNVDMLLSTLNLVNHLGIIADDELRFSKHFGNTVARVYRAENNRIEISGEA